ncbi:MAG: potassium transporter Kup [Gemmatimonadaceae bacterium]|nr:potassium transporter Kup [Gemmatimonadaceae bacterium]
MAQTTEYRPPERHHVEAHPTGKRLGILTLTALGVVYGDIGTSPLYAMKEAFSKPEYGLQADHATIFGFLSLVLWSLILVVSVKYIVFILRADNKGEGGILAMLALLLGAEELPARKRLLFIWLGLFGAALLYGDGIITPAISVLGAMEGLEVVSPAFHPLIVPLTLGIIVGLFSVQRHGTHRVGVLFGPLMLLWFLTIGTLGLVEVIRNPSVLVAINPAWGVRFFLGLGHQGFIALGAVVLAVTGAEALYADMGHFGKRPIRTAWFWLVLPALVLNYFGQGSLLLRDPTAVENPFFLLAPRALLYPMIAIATAAAIIASQALISGAFSLTQQCIQLGYSPRLTVVHTSAREFGQIYVPEVNAALAVGTVLVVLGFRNTGALGAAYGIAVTGTMVITSILYFAISTERWRKPVPQALALTAVFLVVDIAFLGANIVKVLHGGWVPLLLGAALFTMMTSWKRGREILRERVLDIALPLDTFLEDIARKSIHRVPGTAVFMTSESAGVPVVLLHHLKHNQVLHETVLLLSIVTDDVPEVPRPERVRIEALGQGFFRVVAHYGFMESADVKEVLQKCRDSGIATRPLNTSYYLGREQLIPRKGPWKKDGMTMNYLRKQLFALMSKNALSATQYFQLPPNRVVELGTQMEF